MLPGLIGGLEMQLEDSHTDQTPSRPTLALKDLHLVEEGGSADDALPVASVLQGAEVFAADREPLLRRLAADPQDAPDGLPGVPRLTGSERGLSEQTFRFRRSLSGGGHKQEGSFRVLVEPRKESRYDGDRLSDSCANAGCGQRIE